jgi:hypothetical protein
MGVRGTIGRASRRVLWSRGIIDPPVAASALARFRAFFALRFSAVARAGAKFASGV